MIEGLAFDAETHRYTFEGKPYPSVTRVLKLLDLYGPIDPADLAFAAARGSAVHEATALDDRDDLDDDSLDPQIRPYIDAWRRFKAEANYSPWAIELPVVHGRFEYAGTLDRVASIQGKFAVLDIKSGLIPITAGPQLAAYKEAYDWLVSAALVPRPPEMPKRRYVVQLRADGTYRLEQFTSPEDFGVFRGRKQDGEATGAAGGIPRGVPAESGRGAWAG